MRAVCGLDLHKDSASRVQKQKKNWFWRDTANLRGRQASTKWVAPVWITINCGLYNLSGAGYSIWLISVEWNSKLLFIFAESLCGGDGAVKRISTVKWQVYIIVKALLLAPRLGNRQFQMWKGQAVKKRSCMPIHIPRRREIVIWHCVGDDCLFSHGCLAMPLSG